MRNIKRSIPLRIKTVFTRLLILATLSAHMLWIPAASQSNDEAQWWFDVEFVAFKRSLLPSNNEDFEKADFAMTQVKAIDLFSLAILQQQRPFKNLIQQLPICEPGLEPEPESEIDSSLLNAITAPLTKLHNESVAPAVDLELLQTDKLNVQRTELIDVPVEPAENKVLDTEMLHENADSDEASHSSQIALPLPYSFENEDTAMLKLMCAKQEEILAQEPTNFSKIPTHIFAKDSVYNGSHVLINQQSATLEEYIAKVFKQRDIEPLLYTAWRQEVVFGEENADYFQVRAGELLKIEEHFDYETELAKYNKVHAAATAHEIEQNNEALFAALTEALQEKTPVNWLAEQAPIQTNNENVANNEAKWELDGLFKVYLDYVNQVPYLHISTEFKHYKINIDANGQGNIATFPLKQRRRIISRQIHYFDHPAFGIIVRLERFKPPVIIEEEEVDTE